MAEILKGYNLGEQGINVAKSPIHLTDGELVSAQNAEFYAEGGRGAIRKRPGLQRFNGSSLAGTVEGVIGVPLAAPNELYLVVPVNLINATSIFLHASVDSGATWDSVSAQNVTGDYQWPQLDAIRRSITDASQLSELGIGYKGLGYLPMGTGTGSNDKVILVWRKEPPVAGDAQNGSLFELMRVPGSTQVTGFWRAGDRLYVAAKGTGGFANYVFRVNRTTGAYNLLAIGTTFTPGTEDLMCGAGFINRQFLGTSRANQGRVHYWREEDTTWTVDRTAAANLHTYTSMAVYKGNLYAATMALAGTAAIIERRTPAGTWSTSLTGPHSTQANYFDTLWVHRGELFATYMTRGATDICSLYKFNNSSWVIDEDLSALTETPSIVHGLTSLGTDLFLAVSNKTGSGPNVWKRASGGAFTRVLDVPTNFILGPLVVF